ncbi:MAG: 1-(5-phosphoribosyl)-5-[(5-phosphoribosylamino)methylideneamino]imidazole-4-carboxamide isomerase [Syntrophales bacterium]|nr:1-(5-phosphoribosyl)-5-[(5-phosphoribosylamino)methylideneamino]imidazole-4-carboxamide isomerase [Syntrophales bacterium]MCK9527684.1 1-(5-phosphoribosyl)-5-[(5-phosphoribosylamino)methylideneamino]imidazole-4-carboxamide isomerase [Syntrophales bacterium]MDX9921661.1 1-(5-phosphoribosyl)-5-[(5-phosphoribosylamino)methylideneamino]imidazole-4-carboxamide isomerase [Syntrophales bacterium]
MIVIPAIDIRGGKCVRLLQGDFTRVTVYGDDPVAVADKWRSEGATRIHVVDLDGSKDGKPVNRHIIEAVVRAVDVPVQVGGGIRHMETVEEYIAAGVASVVLGTAALKDRNFVLSACLRFPGRIILGIDARGDRVAAEGWLEETGYSPLEIARSYEGCGLEALVYTDIGRDGMQTGVNRESTELLARSVGIPVIASGGVSGIADIENLLSIRGAGITGVIVGKALYEGKIDLTEAIALCRRTGPA